MNKNDALIALPAEDRLALIAALWESLGDAPPLPARQADELARRLQSFEHDRAAAVPWDDLKAELGRAPA
jgi:putative addiction module component (TIGR02574 family)